MARSTLAEANETRDFRMFQELGQILIRQTLTLYRDEPLGIELQHALYALDCRTIVKWLRSQQPLTWGI